MNIPEISIIVPVYNVGTYIRKCIDSILTQTFTNFELILVDDGSSDNSLQICNEYARQDSRVLVISKENGGQASARNMALDIARGNFVGFVDGDDWVSSEMFQTLYETANENDADITQCGWYKVEPDGNIKNPFPTNFKEIYSSKSAIDELLSSQNEHLNTSVCCKLFSRNIISEYRFPIVRAYEDDEFVFKTVLSANKVICISSPLYYYLNREESTMTARFNMNKVALVTIQKNICDFLKVHYPERFQETQKTLCSKQFYILNCLLLNSQLSGSSQEAKKIKEDILCSYREYINNPYMGRNKLMLILIKYTPQLIWSTVLRIKFSRD